MNDLRLAEFAVTLSRYRHFARAAQAIGVSQPTLSRGIARLEREMGSPLFERTTRSVQPTSFGLAFVERAERLLQDAKALAELRAADGDALVGQLAIGSGPYALELCVLPSVAQLAARHPRVRIRVVEGPWRNLPEMLLQGAVDLVVIYARLFATDQRVDVESLPPHPGRLVCRVGHPLTRRRRVSEADIDPYPLVGVSMSGGAPRLLGDALYPFARKFAVDPLTGDVVPTIATTSLYAAREIIRRTDGIGLFAEPQVRDDVAASRLVVLETDFATPSTAYAMVWLRDRRLSPPAAEFTEVMREVARETVGGTTARRGRTRSIRT